MAPFISDRRGRARTPVLGVLAAICGAVVFTAVMSSCLRYRQLGRRRPLRLEGVPVVRVRLNARPLETAEVSTTGAWEIRGDDRLLLKGRRALKATPFSWRDGDWRFLANLSGAETLTVDPLDGRAIFDGREYRGKLCLVRSGDGVLVVNHVDLESYLTGVLAKELYSHWALEAFRAQAVAARTFALFHMTRSGLTRDYDLTDTQSSQVYGGFTAETDKAWRAVRSTHGIALAYGPVGREEIFLTQYSACCGGVVNTARVLRDAPDIPPLRGGQVCDDCRDCPRYRWPSVRVSKRELYRCLAREERTVAKLGALRAVRVARQTDYGRPLWAEVVGPDGRVARVRYDVIRGALIRGGAEAGRKLQSMNCSVRDLGANIEFVNGRGFGHGVGLCQWGAQRKASDGWTAEQILDFYYPGAERVSIY
jgi:stage II sporulation protein D (peptidoglycan lytic transglycosylase)